MILSHGTDRKQVHRGIQESLRQTTGARAVRVIDAARSTIPEHSHDWPVLSLYVMGDVIKVQDGGEIRVNRPAVMLHGPNEAHSVQVRSQGLEQIDIEFDPDWLPGAASLARERQVRIWSGGRVAAAGRRLRQLWQNPETPEGVLRLATAQLLQGAWAGEAAPTPPWLEKVFERVHSLESPCTDRLARELGLHPSWLAQAYKASVGEGVRETAVRARVEHATQLLSMSGSEPSQIAVASGFCDQSHMIRCFKRLLGRTPSRVKAERLSLRSAPL